MSVAEAAILGLVQGLTEFLPVSSSAHLVLAQHLLGFRTPLVAFDVVLHLGTLVSLLIYFARDAALLLRDSVYGLFFLIRKKPAAYIFERAPHSRWALAIVAASIPTALIGFLFKDWFEALFGSLRAVGTALLVNSVLLWSTRYFQKGEKEIEKAAWLDGLFVGTLQAVAIIPGISRSGTTIAAGLFRGLTKETAFRFAFLLAIPAIAGAALLELRGGFVFSEISRQALAAGFLTALLSGLLAIFLLARLVREGKLHLFAPYTLLLGLVVLFWLQRFE